MRIKGEVNIKDIYAKVINALFIVIIIGLLALLWNSKGEPIKENVNVKVDFHAKGDGVADDTAAIQKAINSIDKGIIYFPPGNYLVKELKLKNDITLTSFNDALQYTGQNASVVMVAAENTNVMFDTEDVSGYSISGITFNGKDKKTSGISGGYNGSIKNCKFYKCDFGIGKNLKNEYSGNLFTADIEDCYFDSCINGIGNSIDSKINNNFIYSCHIGIKLTGSDNTITGNKIEWNEACGISALGASHCVIANNIIDRSGTNGLYLDKDSSSDSITGNIFRRNGVNGEGDKEKSHILIEGATDIVFTGNVTVAENSRDDKSGKLVPDISVYCENSKNVSFVGNNLSGAIKHSIVKEKNENLNIDFLDK